MYIDEDENKWLYSITKNADKVIAQVIKETREEIAANVFTMLVAQKIKDEKDMLEKLSKACGITSKKLVELIHDIAEDLQMSDTKRSLQRIVKSYDREGRKYARFMLEEFAKKYDSGEED